MRSIVPYLLERVYQSTGCLSGICLRGKMFTEPLPSSGSVRNNMLYSYSVATAGQQMSNCPLFWEVLVLRKELYLLTMAGFTVVEALVGKQIRLSQFRLSPSLLTTPFTISQSLTC
jgi:hypothetical protein